MRTSWLGAAALALTASVATQAQTWRQVRAPRRHGHLFGRRSNYLGADPMEPRDPGRDPKNTQRIIIGAEREGVQISEDGGAYSRGKWHSSISSHVMNAHLAGVSRMPSFGKRRIVDRATNTERKGQLAVYQCGSRQTGEGVGEKTLLRRDLCDAAVVEFVGAGDTDTAGAIDIDSVAVDIDLRANNPQ